MGGPRSLVPGSHTFGGLPAAAWCAFASLALARCQLDPEVGRGEEAYDRAFSRGRPLVPIDTAPYHAAAFGLSDLGTKGGLRTDTLKVTPVPNSEVLSSM